MNSFDTLKHLGCTQDESWTFDALLAHQEGITVVTLSKLLNKPRATLYDHLHDLTEKGLVRKGRNERGAVFYPAKPKMIKGVFEEKSHTIARAGTVLGEHVASFPENLTYDPRFTVIDNSNAAEIIFRDVLRDKTKESHWFWPARELFYTVVSKEVFTNWQEERVRKNMKIKVLWPCKQRIKNLRGTILGFGEDKKALRQIRILPARIDTTMGYGIYGNKVGFISSRRENYGFIVDSKELAETMKSKFNFLWKISKKRT